MIDLTPARFGPKNWARDRLQRRRSEALPAGVAADVRAGSDPPAAARARPHASRITRDTNVAWSLDEDLCARRALSNVHPSHGRHRADSMTYARTGASTRTRRAASVFAADDELSAPLRPQEVRRVYPFFPVVAASLARNFEWRGARFDGRPARSCSTYTEPTTTSASGRSRTPSGPSASSGGR